MTIIEADGLPAPEAGVLVNNKKKKKKKNIQ